jgi:hypothetical protein
VMPSSCAVSGSATTPWPSPSPSTVKHDRHGNNRHADDDSKRPSATSHRTV